MAVIDASVAVRWFVYGIGNDEAALWLGKPDLIAPDLIIPEVGNALWRYLQRNHLELAEATAILARLPACFSRLVSVESLVNDALLLAHEHDHPIYDCFYLALAKREGTSVVTLDLDLARIAEKMGMQTFLLLPEPR